MTTTTITINDQLVELGTLVDNQDTSIQRVGAEMIEQFFITHQEGDNVDDATLAMMLYYLTDIQVRDYALGLLEPDNADRITSALSYLMNAAPTDTIYINAPATLLAVLCYEGGDLGNAFLTLSVAQEKYSLRILLDRVFRSHWPAGGFAKMRAELHPQVTAGIFGTTPVPGDPEDLGIDK
jgi:hypothetical protein